LFDANISERGIGNQLFFAAANWRSHFYIIIREPMI